MQPSRCSLACDKGIMALSSQLREFHSRWMNKARSFGQENLDQTFDKFFTLYVVFNHLYVQATFRLASQGRVIIEKRNTFPDAEAAQEYVVQFVGATHLTRELNNDPNVRAALESITGYVCNRTFSFELDRLTGEAQPDKDTDLCNRLASTSRNAQASAILETLYAVRCNMFHGRKGLRSNTAGVVESSKCRS
jgi:hypothetical protein